MDLLAGSYYSSGTLLCRHTCRLSLTLFVVYRYLFNKKTDQHTFINRKFNEK